MHANVRRLLDTRAPEGSTYSEKRVMLTQDKLRLVLVTVLPESFYDSSPG
jgi:hypothetical protein